MKSPVEVEFEGAHFEYTLALEECAWALREMLAVGGTTERRWADAAAARMEQARIARRLADAAMSAELDTRLGSHAVAEL